VDEIFLRRTMEEIHRNVEFLRSQLPVEPEDLERDVLKRWAVERGLQVTIQAVLDAGTHILSELGGDEIESYREVFSSLAARGVLDPSFAEQIAPMAAFRNILVHDYAVVDLRIMCSVLRDRLGDFTAFTDAIRRFLAAR
jgi:uncharacterized protein YutE (UPF0331/DUF86 family)